MTEDEMVGWLTRSMDTSLSELREMVEDRRAWRAVVHGITKRQTQLRDRTTTTQRPHGPHAMGSGLGSVMVSTVATWLG